jgi:hypothetical protein
MKYYIYTFIILLASCSQPDQTPTPQFKMDSLPAPDQVKVPHTTAEFLEEKHFDCWIVEKTHIKGETMYVTECGIAFYSKNRHSVGDTLRNFHSPKHK